MHEKERGTNTHFRQTHVFFLFLSLPRNVLPCVTVLMSECIDAFNSTLHLFFRMCFISRLCCFFRDLLKTQRAYHRQDTMNVCVLLTRKKNVLHDALIACFFSLMWIRIFFLLLIICDARTQYLTMKSKSFDLCVKKNQMNVRISSNFTGLHLLALLKITYWTHFRTALFLKIT